VKDNFIKCLICTILWGFLCGTILGRLLILKTIDYTIFIVCIITLPILIVRIVSLTNLQDEIWEGKYDGLKPPSI
jgi:hypothetical protein